MSIDDKDKLGVINKEEDVKREKEIKYTYRIVNNEIECEDEPKDVGDNGNNNNNNDNGNGDNNNNDDNDNNNNNNNKGMVNLGSEDDKEC